MADSDSPTPSPLPYLPEPSKRRSPAGVVALVVGVLAIVGGGVFAVTQLAGDEGSPEGAAERLFDAFGDEDLLGVLEALPPSERDAFQEPLEELVDELKRLEILSGDLDLRHLSGVEASFEGLRFSSQPLGDDLAAVKIEDGTIRTTADPSKLPLGDFVRDLAGESLTGAEPVTEEEDAASEDRLVAVKEDGRWYVSLWYTVAESARVSAGAPRPNPVERVQPAGEPSPETAVDALIRATGELDVRRVIQLMPPDEGRALHDYASLFLDQLDQATADLGKLFDLDITRLELEAEEDGDRALVRVRSMEFDAVVGEGFRVSYRDGCATVTAGPGEQQRICPADFAKGGPNLFGRVIGGDLPALDVGRPDLGFVTVRRDGAWYVSPTRTVLENLTALLRVFDRTDLDQLAEYVGRIIGFDP